MSRIIGVILLVWLVPHVAGFIWFIARGLFLGAIAWLIGWLLVMGLIVLLFVGLMNS